jgi:hypothetical protein
MLSTGFAARSQPSATAWVYDKSFCYTNGSALEWSCHPYQDDGTGRPTQASRSIGEWLSLVEHLVRDQGVGGSNPLSPTKFSYSDRHGSGVCRSGLPVCGDSIQQSPDGTDRLADHGRFQSRDIVHRLQRPASSIERDGKLKQTAAQQMRCQGRPDRSRSPENRDGNRHSWGCCRVPYRDQMTRLTKCAVFRPASSV